MREFLSMVRLFSILLGLSFLISTSVAHAGKRSDCTCKPTGSKYEARSEPARVTDICTKSSYSRFCRMDWNFPSKAGSGPAAEKSVLTRTRQTAEAVSKKTKSTANPEFIRDLLWAMGWGSLNPKKMGLYNEKPLDTITGFLSLAGIAMDRAGEGKMFDRILGNLKEVPTDQIRTAFKPLISFKSEPGNITDLGVRIGVAPGCLRIETPKAEKLKFVAVSSLIGRNQKPCRAQQ